MQAHKLRSDVDVKRGMDLVRNLLLAIEDDPMLDGNNELQPESAEQLGIGDCSYEELSYHLALLIDAGFLKGDVLPNTMPVITRMTWEGHELLDNIRDPSIWDSTKKRLAGLPSVAIAIVGEIAKAEIKKKLGLS